MSPLFSSRTHVATIVFLHAPMSLHRFSSRTHIAHRFSSRFSAKKWWKNGPLGPCKDLLEKRALALVAHGSNAGQAAQL